VITVAALYVDPRGPYPHIPGVEWWGLPYRDAKLYPGWHPIVAHPPCGPWGAMRHLSRKQDPLCAVHAVGQARKWRGVLEHPAGSKLWAAMGLPLPGQSPDWYGGYTVEVSQCDWGHVARKRTWLYLVGVPRSAIVVPAARKPTHWVSGGRTNSSRKGSPVPPGIKVCSAQQRRRTPPAFAEYLVSLARAAAESRAA
jgi:hypothetical protein